MACSTIFSLFSSDFEDKIDLWMNGEITPSQFLSELDSIERDVDTKGDPDINYQNSILNLYRGAVYYNIEDKKNSIIYLEEAMTLAQKDVTFRNTPDAYRILSEAGSYLMIQKGFRYIIKNSKEINEYAETALKFDPQNSKAEAIIANGLINAPKIFGGDLDRGVTIIERLLVNKDITNEQRYNMLISLAKALEKKDYALEAEKIYPNNQKIKELLATFKR